MLKSGLLLSIILLSLTGCGIAQQMNDHINQSTCSIYANIEAVRADTDAINRNRAVIEESTRTIAENNQRLIEMSK